MGKQTQTFDKAQALAMHYIPCCGGEADVLRTKLQILQ